LYTLWKWPTPLTLTDVIDHSFGHHVWDRNHPSARGDVMPVLTPVYPAMNTTHNVTEGSLSVLNREWNRGREIMAQIRNPGTKSQRESPWKKLIEPSDFFRSYPNYLQIEFRAPNEADSERWYGICESKLRLFPVLVAQSSPIRPHLFP